MTEKREMRRFGWTMGVAFALLGGLLLWRGRGEPMVAFALAAAFLLLAAMAPALLRPVHKGWMTLAAGIGWVMTRFILSLLFFLVFTLVGGIGRLLGKQFLDLDMKRPARTFWVERPARSVDPARYQKQH